MTAPETTPIFPETTLAAEDLILRPFTPAPDSIDRRNALFEGVVEVGALPPEPRTPVAGSDTTTGVI